MSVKEEKAANKLIEKEIHEAEEELLKNPPACLLLLGPGDSGKTTLLKQMKILHGEGFSDVDRLDNLKKIRQNIIENMQALIKAAETLGLALSEPAENISSKITSLDSHEPVLSKETALLIKKLWKGEDAVKAAYARANEFFIQDTANYFFENVERFADDKCSPSNQDILYTRYATTKISETMFNIGGAKYQVIDVGGQTKYRAAWPRFFDNSDAILFIVSLASYDQTMEEDGHRTVNRMEDSLSLFDKISNHELLQKIAIILLMNKSDLAEQKVTRSSLSKYFSDYTGRTNNFEGLKGFFKSKFTGLNRNQQRTVYTHFTTNTDTKLMEVIIKSIIDIVIKMQLQATGLY